MEFKSLGKKARSVMFLKRFIKVIIIILLLVVIRILLPINMINDFVDFKYIDLLFLLLIIYNLLTVLIYPVIRYNRYKYYVSKDEVVVRKGIFFLEKTIIPIERVQKIEMNNGPILRKFGLSNVVVYTASGEIIIDFLNNDIADDIVKKIKDILKVKLGEKSEK